MALKGRSRHWLEILVEHFVKRDNSWQSHIQQLQQGFENPLALERKGKCGKRENSTKTVVPKKLHEKVTVKIFSVVTLLFPIWKSSCFWRGRWIPWDVLGFYPCLCFPLLWVNCGLESRGPENTRTWHFPGKCSAPSDAVHPKEQCGKAIVLLNYLPTLLFCIPGFQFTTAK